jgi:hypothetical protein
VRRGVFTAYYHDLPVAAPQQLIYYNPANEAGPSYYASN